MLEEKKEKARKAATGDGPTSKKAKVTAAKKTEAFATVRETYRTFLLRRIHTTFATCVQLDTANFQVSRLRKNHPPALVM